MSGDNPCSELYCNRHSILDYLRRMKVRVSRADVCKEFSIADKKFVSHNLKYLVSTGKVCATYDSEHIICFFQDARMCV